jgi:alpha-L-fucosidase
MVNPSDLDSTRLADAIKERENNKQRTQWFRDAKFGVFIHWNPSSVAGVEISWGRECFPPEMHKPDHTWGPTIPQDEYDSLYKQFNPVLFDADAWVRTFRDLGFKYLVFVTKHHDGFSMFDDPYTNYKICSEGSPVKYDITRQIIDACRKYGLRIGLYYSLLDWFHPDYYNQNHYRFLQFQHNQVEWLLSQYGLIDIIWFDAGSVTEIWDGHLLYQKVVSLQPNILLSSRLGRYKQDFESIEGRAPDFNNGIIWERDGSVIEW